MIVEQFAGRLVRSACERNPVVNKQKKWNNQEMRRLGFEALFTLEAVW